jgi:excisionase family DNA binding protein
MCERISRSTHRESPGDFHADAGFLTVREFAGFLGVSEKTVRRLIATGRLRCIRIGRLVRIERGDVSRWLSARKE